MEALTHQTDEPADATAAAAFPSWALLNWYGSRTGDASVAGDDRTVAESCTSTGWPFRVSFGLVPPPSSSCLNYTWLGGWPPRADTSDRPKVISAHGDVVLFELRTAKTNGDPFYNIDCFLYEAGAARPPSVSLLPACFITMQYERRGGAAAGPSEDGSARWLQEEDTVVLRRGGGDLLVAQLEVSYGDEDPEMSNDEDEVPDAPNEEDEDEPAASNRERRMNAELCVLRPGRGEWELKQAVPIVYDDKSPSPSGGRGAELLPDWHTDAAIPVGDRYLCFVDYFRGMLLCDTAGMGSHSFTLRYVPLPVEAPDHVWCDERPRMHQTRNLSAVAGSGGAVRFVSVDPRCCCGGPGRSGCARGRFAFTVTTWTLDLTTDADEAPATWVKEGVKDCEEVWELPAYEGIPRVHLEHPIVSPDNPDVVCFTVCEDNYAISSKKKIWEVEVNTRSKELLSVMPCTIEPWRAESRVAVKLMW